MREPAETEKMLQQCRNIIARTQAIIAALPHEMHAVFHEEDTSQCSSKYRVFYGIVYDLVDGVYTAGFCSGEDQVSAVDPLSREHKKPLNHDLLERALPFLGRQARGLVESSCTLRQDGDDFSPIPGTCAEDSAQMIEPMLQLIREIESEIGPVSEVEPAWFVNLVDRRWSLTGKEGGV